MNYVTQDDLQVFKREFLIEISQIIGARVGNPNQKEYFSTEEVKQYLGIKSVNTVKKLLTPIKIGGKNRYLVSDVKKIMEGKKQLLTGEMRRTFSKSEE